MSRFPCPECDALMEDLECGCGSYEWLPKCDASEVIDDSTGREYMMQVNTRCGRVELTLHGADYVSGEFTHKEALRIARLIVGAAEKVHG